MTIDRFQTTARMSKAVRCNGVVYLAGIVVEAPVASVAEETAEILAAIDALLLQAGSDKGRLLFAQFWVTDMAHYVAMNQVWDAWLPPGAAPARACVTAGLARPHARVEIMVTAAVS
jgi:enamine deaminase RidA (YjgF/YER057c/UK114 family)